MRKNEHESKDIPICPYCEKERRIEPKEDFYVCMECNGEIYLEEETVTTYTTWQKPPDQKCPACGTDGHCVHYDDGYFLRCMKCGSHSVIIGESSETLTQHEAKTLGETHYVPRYLYNMLKSNESTNN